jgi:hypothetical protein
LFDLREISIRFSWVALRWNGYIRNPLRKDCARRHIAVGLAKTNISAAKTIAASIEDDFHREKALLEIEAQQTV